MAVLKKKKKKQFTDSMEYPLKFLHYSSQKLKNKEVFKHKRVFKSWIMKELLEVSQLRFQVALQNYSNFFLKKACCSYKNIHIDEIKLKTQTNSHTYEHLFFFLQRIQKYPL